MQHQPPLQPPPRKVKTRKLLPQVKRHSPLLYLLSYVSIVVPILATIPAMALYFIMNRQATNYQKIAEEGAYAEAIITRVYPNGSIIRNDVNPIIIQYTFEGDSSTITNEITTFDIQDSTQLQKGDLLNINYLGDQSVTLDYHPEDSTISLVVPFIPWIFFVLLLPVSLHLRSKLMKLSHIHRHGTIVEGTITSMTIQPNSPILNSEKFLRIHYQYTIGEHIYYGHSLLNQFAKSRYHVDQQIKVIALENEGDCLLSRESIAAIKQ